MNQATEKKGRYGPRRIRNLPQGLREKLNRLVFHGFSPPQIKRIMFCLYQCRISISTIKRHRRYLRSAVGESFKDFKMRGEELEHGRGGYLPPEWLNLYQEASDTPLPTSKVVRERRTVEEEPMYVAEPEVEYNKKKTKILIGKPLD